MYPEEKGGSSGLPSAWRTSSGMSSRKITPIRETPPGAEGLDRFYRHLGLAALAGFAFGASGVAAAVVVQLCLGNWVLSVLCGLLVLFLGPALAARFMPHLLARVPDACGGWLGRLGRAWLESASRLSERSNLAKRESVADGSDASPMANAAFPVGSSRLAQRVVREVMVPRPDVVGVPAEATVGQAAEIMLRQGVSRAPVFAGDLDSTEGVVHVKDVLAAVMRGEAQSPVKAVARSVQFVPETKPLADLLREMQQGGFHLAVVSDEYGSVTGIVTLEDVIEEVVGQISDEFDQEAPEVVALPDGSYRVQASLPIVDLNELLGVELPHASWNTVGGLVFGLAGKIPEAGAAVELEGIRFVVEKVQGRRIVTVLVQPQRAAEPGHTNEASKV